MILLIVLIGGIFYITQQKDAEVLLVEVTLARPPDDNSEHIISNVNASISQARRMEVPEETALASPGITVLVIQDMQAKSGWYSVPIPKSGSIYGNYTIMVKTYEKLNRSRPLVISTRVVDTAGKEVSVKRTSIMLS